MIAWCSSDFLNASGEAFCWVAAIDKKRLSPEHDGDGRSVDVLTAKRRPFLRSSSGHVGDWGSPAWDLTLGGLPASLWGLVTNLWLHASKRVPDREWNSCMNGLGASAFSLIYLPLWIGPHLFGMLLTS